MNADEIISRITHPEDVTDQFFPEDVQSNQISGILASFPMLFWIPLVLAGQSPYAKFCANQGLTLLLINAALGFAGGIAGGLLGWIPVISWIWTGVISLTVGAVSLGSFLLLLISACQGRARKIPLVGDMLQAFK